MGGNTKPEGKTDETVTPPVNTTYGDEYELPEPQTVTISAEKQTLTEADRTSGARGIKSIK